MKIIAHRGFWAVRAEMNTCDAIYRAFREGFGVETDIRDHCGKVVISHDPVVEDVPTLDELISIYREFSTYPLFLNVKADGLHSLKVDCTKEFDHLVFFDMSFPELLRYREKGFRVCARVSKFEPPFEFISNNFNSFWIDNFKNNHFEPTILKELCMDNDHTFCVVSPELHGESHLTYWSQIRDHKLHLLERFYLCTDFPMEAKRYFYD